MADIQHRTVFIGNIPYDATEQQIRNILNTVGPITSLRLVTDAKTGKPKGYGFAEYGDPATAASAIRNLNNTDLNGRSLRVDTADDEKSQQDGRPNQRNDQRNDQRPRSTNQPFTPSTMSTMSTSRFSLGSQAPSSSMPLSFTADSLHTLAQSLTRQQRADMLLEMKKLILTNPEGAKQLLIENPHLTHLLLQCQVGFGLVRAQDIEALQRNAGLSAPSATPQSQQPIIQSNNQPINQPMPQQPQQYIPPPQQYQQMPNPMHPMQPPAHYMQQQQQPHAPPPQQSFMMGMASPEELLARIAPLPPREREIVQELLKLTPDELKQLPQEAQNQVFTILQSIGIS